MKRITTLASIPLLTLAVGVAMANQGEGQKAGYEAKKGEKSGQVSAEQFIKKHDTDGNQELSQEEFLKAADDRSMAMTQQELRSKFIRADVDADDSLTNQELADIWPLTGGEERTAAASGQTTGQQDEYGQDDYGQTSGQQTAGATGQTSGETESAWETESEQDTAASGQTESSWETESEQDTAASGQTESSWENPSEQDTADIQELLESVGETVHTSQGDEIGEIERIVRSDASGEVFAVISAGEFLEVGEREAVIRLVELDLQEDRIVLTAEEPKKALDKPFVASAYTEIEDPSEVAMGGQSGQQQSVQTLIDSSPEQLMGMKVIDADGNEVGEVEAVVQSKTDGNRRLLISSDEVLEMGGDDLTVPADGLTLEGDQIKINEGANMEAYTEDDFEKVG